MRTIPLPHLKKSNIKVDLNNTVVKNLSEEMGKEIISCFKKAGYDTFGFNGSLAINNHLGNSCIDLFHYGVVNGVFGQWSTQKVKDGINVITIGELKELISQKELTFPRRMLVRDYSYSPLLDRLVLTIIPNCQNGVITVIEADEVRYKSGESFSVNCWRQAEEIPTKPQLEEITLSELNKKHGTNYKIIEG